MSIILPPPNLTSTESNYNGYNTTCNGGSDGSIDLSVSGVSGSYSYLWSNGSTTEDLTSLSAGTYSVTVTDANSCTTSAEFILIEAPPCNQVNNLKAEFNMMPDLNIHHFLYQLDNPILFIDKSVDEFTIITKWFWEFEDGFTSNEQDTKHAFENIGDFNITLAIENLNGCVDNTSKRVIINEFLLYIPNSFTPNENDEINDTFLPKGIGVKNYKLEIYSRMGEHFFTSNDLNIGWDGTNNKNKKIAQIGVYVYSINIIDVFGMEHNYTGQVTLIQ